MALLLDVRDPKQNHRLLFQYDPINECIWIKPPHGKLVCVRLDVIKGERAEQIAAYLSAPSANPENA